MREKLCASLISLLLPVLFAANAVAQDAANCCPGTVPDSPVIVHRIVILKDGKFACEGAICNTPPIVLQGEVIAWTLADNHPKEQVVVKFATDNLFGMIKPRIVVTKKEWTWVRVRDHAPCETHVFDYEQAEAGGIGGGGIIVCPPTGPCPPKKP